MQNARTSRLVPKVEKIASGLNRWKIPKTPTKKEMGLFGKQKIKIKIGYHWKLGCMNHLFN